MILAILISWFILSITAGIVVGKCMAFGMGSE
jgi:hypothetical protein